MTLFFIGFLSGLFVAFCAWGLTRGPLAEEAMYPRDLNASRPPLTTPRDRIAPKVDEEDFFRPPRHRSPFSDIDRSKS